MTKFRYKDWWDGKVTLFTCAVFYKEGENPVNCKWEEFIAKDIEKIKSKQTEIFQKSTSDLFEKWCKIFLENYNRSKLKDWYLNDEISDYKIIMFGNKESSIIAGEDVILNLKNHTLPFRRINLLEIRKYINDIIKLGKERNYDFIHSPNSPFQQKDVIAQSEIYAQASWDYFDWLQKFKESRKKNEKRKNKHRPALEGFKDIFAVEDFEKYISVFEKTTPALLNSKWEFIGKARKHKGVICSWISDLKFKSIIKPGVRRSELAYVLNKEIKYLNLGIDGKTFDNVSSEYRDSFKDQIENIIKQA